LLQVKTNSRRSDEVAEMFADTETGLSQAGQRLVCCAPQLPPFRPAANDPESRRSVTWQSDIL
jgi:uncharacterized protein YecE (DUF72 family)